MGNQRRNEKGARDASAENEIIGGAAKSSDWKDVLKSAESTFKLLSVKAGKVAKELERGAKLGAGISRLKVEELTLEVKRDKRLKELGKKFMARTKDIQDPELKGLVQDINALEKQIREKEDKMAQLKKEFRKQ
ncbi:MAG TPA: hypothetical protein VJC03_08070 [bacterium]|nr:hypothetical protein [bacterium]